jgi:hypothetical protein
MRAACMSGMAVLALATVAAGGLTGCGGEAQGRAAAASRSPEARQIIIALDLSGSQSERRRTEARQAVELAIDNLNYGDRIVLLQVHQRSAAEDDAVRWEETVPAPRAGTPPTSLDRERLDAVKQAARSVARTIFEDEAAGRLPTTDLFATLHVAGEYIRDMSAPTALVLLSDMLQSAHGIEMSHAGGVPAASWIAAQHARGLLPRLNGACITVIGADATSPNGVAVREFWKQYFEQAGAVLAERNYRLLATGGQDIACAGG